MRAFDVQNVNGVGRYFSNFDLLKNDVHSLLFSLTQHTHLHYYTLCYVLMNAISKFFINTFKYLQIFIQKFFSHHRICLLLFSSFFFYVFFSLSISSQLISTMIDIACITWNLLDCFGNGCV